MPLSGYTDAPLKEMWYGAKSFVTLTTIKGLRTWGDGPQGSQNTTWQGETTTEGKGKPLEMLQLLYLLSLVSSMLTSGHP